MSAPKISIVMPAYNEADTIDKIIARVKNTPYEKEIIIVDDQSKDGTWDKLQAYASDPQIKLFRHDKNQGKGAALRTGFEHVSGDIVVIQDADLEYDPEDYAVLFKPIFDGHADVVYGSRFLGQTHRVLFFWHYMGNKFLTLLCNMMSNLNLSDMETCYKAFRVEVIKSIKIKSNRFGFEPEFTIKVAKRHNRVYEVPVNYHGRPYSEGKKITWVDGFKAIFAIFWFGFFD